MREPPSRRIRRYNHNPREGYGPPRPPQGSPPSRKTPSFWTAFALTLAIALLVLVIGFVILDAADNRRASPMPIVMLPPTSTPTATATATATQQPTHVPEPTSTTEPTHVPEPTPTTEPTHTPEPTSTPAPTATATSAALAIGPTPTVTPHSLFDINKLRETPAPTVTPEPTPALVPAIAPSTSTPEPTATAARRRVGVSALYPYRNGRYLAQSERDLAEAIVETSWIADGIDETEIEAVQEMVDIAAFHRSVTQSLLTLDWYEDGVRETELRAISYLGSIANDDEPTADLVTGLVWFRDGVTAVEVEVMRNIRLISQDDGRAARRIVAMPFLAALESADISAMESLADLAHFQKDGFDYVMAHNALSAGITDDQAPIVAMLYGVRKLNPGLVDTLLDPSKAIVERRVATLPLSGDVDLTIIRTRPGAARSMDLLEHAVRSSETLMAEPLPTNYVGLLFENSVSGGFAGTNFGTHAAILPKYDVHDGTHEAQFAPHSIAHEVAHYYWSGNADWIDEGAADFMASAIEERRTGHPVGITNDPCAYAANIADLDSLDTDRSSDAFYCNYSLGERLFVDMYDSLGESETWDALRTLYRMSQIKDDPDDDREGTGLGIEHVREAFQPYGNDPATVLARWYDGTEPYDMFRLDTRRPDGSLPNINGRIDRTYVTTEQDGPMVISFSASNPVDQLLLALEYSYDVSGGPYDISLEVVELYEDGFAFDRSTIEFQAEDRYIGGTYWLHVGPRVWAPGRYWIYVYDGAMKVSEAQFEVTP